MKITKTTPIYIYDDIAPAVAFWERSFGFKKIVEVPHENEPGFVLLSNGEREIMFQSIPSLQADVPKVAALVKSGGIVLYCDVDSLEEAIRTIPAANILVPKRRTFYGADEVFFQDSSGAVVAFSQHG